MGYLYFLPLLVWGIVLINQYHLVTSEGNALDVFIPPKTGCNVNWMVQPTGECSWCEGLFLDLMKGLTGSYNPSILNTMPEYKSIARKEDLKGSCFINWVLTNDYGKLKDLFGLGSVAGVGYRSNDWFFFVNRAQKQLFMTWFQGAVDADFGNRYPRTVVVLLDTEGMLIPLTLSGAERNGAKKALSTEVSLLRPCFLCPTESSSFVWNEASSKNPWDESQCVSTPGYGSETTSFYNDAFYDGNNPIDDAFQDLDRIYFESWRPSPAQFKLGISYVIGSASKHLNISGTVEKSDIERPSLITCFDCHSPPAFSKVDSVVFSTEDSSFVYCKAKSSTKDKPDTLSALLLPFDLHTWEFLIGSFLLIWPVFGFRNVMVLIGSLLAQGLRSTRFRGLVTVLVIILIVIQLIYANFFASNAVVPFEEPPIRSNQELFDQGFKIVSTSDIELSEYAELYEQYYKHSLDKVQLNRGHLEQYFLRLKSAKIIPLHEQLTLTRNFGTKSVGRRLKYVVITLAENGTRGTMCHMLEDSWETKATRMYFTGHLMNKFRSTLNQLLSAGLGEFWTSVQTSTKYREAKKAVSSLESASEEILIMNTALRTVTMVYFLVLLVILIFFAVEVYLGRKIMTWWRGGGGGGVIVW